MQGWIKIHRKIQLSELWHKEPFTYGQAWIDLLMLANHKDDWLLIRGNKVPIKRGQIGWSKDRLAEKWKWSRGKVNRYLRLLETIQQIEQQKSVVISLITVKNYDQYQSSDTDNGTPDSTADGRQTVQQTDTNKNVKKEKNVKNGIPLQSSIADIQAIMDIFYRINPTLNFGNKTQRKAVDEMIQKFTFEKTRGLAEYAVSVQGQPFSPTITTPYQLKERASALLAFNKKNQSNKIISV